MKITKFILVFFVLVSFFSSCKVLTPTEMLQTPENYPKSNFEPSRIEYILQPYDRIAIRVTTSNGESFFGNMGDGNNGAANYQRNQSGFEFLIEYDGTVKLPIVGRTEIIGKTVREAETFLEDLFSKYFNNPYILLTVTNKKVLIYQNSATQATVLNFSEEKFTLVEAIARIGGLSSTSKAYKIKLIRGNLTNKPQVYFWNISSIEELNKSNIYLENNDIIYVDSKKQIVSKVLREISPYLTLLTTAISIYGIFFKK